MNKATTTYYTVPLDELQSEIARLKAELEKATKEKDAVYELCKIQSANLARNAIDIRMLNNRYFETKEERDEARQWARYFYQLWKGKMTSMPALDGRVWDQYPAVAHA